MRDSVESSHKTSTLEGKAEAGHSTLYCLLFIKSVQLQDPIGSYKKPVYFSNSPYGHRTNTSQLRLQEHLDSSKALGKCPEKGYMTVKSQAGSDSDTGLFPCKGFVTRNSSSPPPGSRFHSVLQVIGIFPSQVSRKR